MKPVTPYIDAHCHLHGLSYDAWETLGVTGIAAAVISSGNPHEHREVHEEAPGFAEVRRLWDHPIKLAEMAEQKHGFKVFVAFGISSMTRVRDWERLIEVLPQYLRLPRVVALGEAGIDPIQYFGLQWPLDEQKAALAEQVRVAKEAGVPFILHTPKMKKQRDYVQPLVFSDVPTDGYKRHVLDMDLEIINKIGFDHKRLIVDHSDSTIIDYVLRETDAYVGIRVAQIPTETPPQFFVDMVERYGPERLIINTDLIIYSSCDLMAIPKTIREMRRRNIEEQSIRRVVFDNANELFRLKLEP